MPTFGNIQIQAVGLSSRAGESSGSDLAGKRKNSEEELPEGGAGTVTGETEDNKKKATKGKTTKKWGACSCRMKKYRSLTG
jgi:hypothetical protein